MNCAALFAFAICPPLLAQENIPHGVVRIAAIRNEIEGPAALDSLSGNLGLTPAHQEAANGDDAQNPTVPRTTTPPNRGTGDAKLGIAGMDAHWSEYGPYLQELIETVQAQWYHVLEESRVSPPHGSHVVVKFQLNSKGETDIIKVEDFESGRQGVFSCVTAIQAKQPYRKWTKPMIATLGKEQTLDFAFYYK